MIQINGKTSIEESELRFAYSRSSGPGGQNVNKLNTRVELFFDVAASASLGDAQKRQIRGRLANRIDKDGVLRIVSQRYRTQKGNQIDAVEKFRELIRSALVRQRRRIPTKVPRRAKEKRLKRKNIKSEKKQLRRDVIE
ncbi:Peptidyl-tRNA hydrolase YaeJ [Limihaloglobus sulfuriphilus]|uniref:Peptidyl-tRNA hydrolase YaeJ n=1 Tax=Limihaloglobus sulfuriphilus TaxID=1851148 RepID=A0A1Q2MGN1_9BACT|nr:alternative ribosome rescue aminoacyl-tRNA hydrolase ArfB [Limihaloglobus sulfuriphilus]AQQ71840.1 Peptidyl-tRNA hydrolase YaeJ [Limihaloglobus sulfuriphilus]